MIRIQDIVNNIVQSDEEGFSALSGGFMNLSAYAKKIKREVELKSHKDVGVPSIVVALSRYQKSIKKTNPLIQSVQIDNIIIKSPLTEIVFEKSPIILSQLSSLYKKIKTGNDDFLTMTVGTNEITIICSDRIKNTVLDNFKEKPQAIYSGLASIGLTINPKYYKMPNITFSLIRKIAQRRIVLAETISNYTEIIFVFNQKDLSEMANIFKVE